MAMNRDQLIAVAKGIGWSLERESTRSSEIFIVSTPSTRLDGLTFYAEDLALDFIVGQITGSNQQKNKAEELTGRRGKMLKEMLEYKHPTMTQVRSYNVYSKGNVYAWHERKEGTKPTTYTLSVGFEVDTGLNVAFYVLKAEAPNSDATSREKAMTDVYNQWLEWKKTQEDSTAWVLQNKR